MTNIIHDNQNLDYRDFSGQCLIGVQFVNCSIRFCNFQNCDLSYSKFQSCDLYCSKLNDSIFYFTRIIDCDLTKANFIGAFLNGIRIKDATIVYTDFGENFRTNKERKYVPVSEVNQKYLKVAVGNSLPEITELEASYEGIYVADNNMAFKFLDNSENEWRIWRRKSEIALSVKRILEENGYNDGALKYYYLHRKFLRMSNKNSFMRLLDYVGNDLFWGYGVSIHKPVISFFVNCLLFSIVYSCLPLFNSFSGIEIKNEVLNIFDGGNIDMIRYFKILYSSFLISTLSVFGDIDVVGYAKIFATLHIILSVLLIGLGITALSKKLANS